MITAERKPMDEIMASIDGCGRILLVGCNECVTVCAAGGRKEVALLASALQMASMKKGRMGFWWPAAWKGTATSKTAMSKHCSG